MAKVYVLLRLPIGQTEDPGTILQRAKPHRSWTEAQVTRWQQSWSGRWGSWDRAPPTLRPPTNPVLTAGPLPSPAFEVTGASGQEHVVGVPVQAEDGGTDGLLDVLAHPPGHGGGHTDFGGERDRQVSALGPQRLGLQAPTGPCRPQRSQEGRAQASWVPPWMGALSTSQLPWGCQVKEKSAHWSGWDLNSSLSDPSPSSHPASASATPGRRS